jgi:hypothetical protein
MIDELMEIEVAAHVVAGRHRHGCVLVVLGEAQKLGTIVSRNEACKGLAELMRTERPRLTFVQGTPTWPAKSLILQLMCMCVTGTTLAYVGNIEGESGPNTVGVRALRVLRDKLHADYPELTAVKGLRSSGAGPGRTQEVTLKHSGVAETFRREFDSATAKLSTETGLPLCSAGSRGDGRRHLSEQRHADIGPLRHDRQRPPLRPRPADVRP